MSLLTLPTEIIFLALDHIDEPELFNLCLTNKRLARLVQPRLFRHPSLTNPRTTVKYCMLVASRPDLALAAHTILLGFRVPTPESLWKPLSQGLSCMNNIISLYLVGVLSGVIFRDVTFPRLKLIDSMHYFQLEVPVFLGRHPTVTKLSLGCDRIQDVPQDFLPFLEVFVGTSFVAEKLVPGRPVKELILDWRKSSSEARATDIVKSLSLSSVPVNRFTCMTTYVEDTRVSLLSAIARYLPDLQMIQLSSPTFVGFLDKSFTESLASLLPSFKQLRILEVPLIGVDLDQDDSSVGLHEIKLSTERKKLCPELLYIQFPSCHMYMYDTSSLAWIRTESIPSKSATLFSYPF